MKTIIVILLSLITFYLCAQESQQERWQCYFVIKDNHENLWVWNDQTKKDEVKGDLYLSKVSFNVQKGIIKEKSQPQILWKKRVVQVVSDYFFPEANAYFFSTRSDSDPMSENMEDMYHFFDINNPLKVYRVPETSYNQALLRRDDNKLQLQVIMYGDSPWLKTFITPALKSKTEKTFDSWKKNVMSANMVIDSSYQLRFASIGLNKMPFGLSIPPKLLLENNIPDTYFFLQYNDKYMAVLIPQDDRTEQIVLYYNKVVKKWDIYKIFMHHPIGRVIGNYYIIHDSYHLPGEEITMNINIIDLTSGEIRSLCLPLNSKVIAIQGNLWILTLPGRLMFLRKTGQKFQKIGTILSEDAEKITFAWIKKTTQKVSPVK